jgi:cytochrome c oxidase subunit 2
LALAAAALALLTGACGGGGDHPQSVLAPDGPVSRQLDRLWDPVFAIAVVIFFLIQGLTLWVAIAYRRRSEDDSPKQIHGSKVLELGWTAAPALLLAGVGFFTVVNLVDLDRVPKGPDVLTVEVVGHQWWWEYQYPKSGVITANELHIPALTKIDVRVTSVDVIHSFWPPKLAGKIDAVPGRINHMVLEADADDVGKTFFGQCAEFCGLSHANMRLKVVVHDQAGFARWQEAQQKDAVIPRGDAAGAAGADLFRAKGCGGCHTIQGYTAGKYAPNLTHFMDRKVFAGAIFPNDIDALRTWLRDPPKAKPMMPKKGLGMPNLNLAETEINDLIAFLQTLK